MNTYVGFGLPVALQYTTTLSFTYAILSGFGWRILGGVSKKKIIKKKKKKKKNNNNNNNKKIKNDSYNNINIY